MTRCKLIITDIDNTLFDWIHYYAHCYSRLIKFLSARFSTPEERLIAESAAVFEKHASTEYPFVIQELPSLVAYFSGNSDALISEAVQPGRDEFLAAASEALVPYPEVRETLADFKKDGIKIAALTDAPRYVAMWKLNKLGLLEFFDAIYGLPDPKIPVSHTGEALVHPSILIKHLQGWDFGFKGQIRILPSDYEKPDPKGLKTVLMDFNLDNEITDRKSIIWIGDNPYKDITMGLQLGLTTVWARYGADLKPEYKKVIDGFSTPRTLRRNLSFSNSLPGNIPNPDFAIERFRDLSEIV